MQCPQHLAVFDVDAFCRPIRQLTGRCQAHPAPHTLFSDFGSRQANRDGDQITPERRSVLNFRGAVKKRDKHVLHEVVEPLIRAQRNIDHAAHEARVPIPDDRNGFPLAGRCARHQASIRAFLRRKVLQRRQRHRGGTRQSNHDPIEVARGCLFPPEKSPRPAENAVASTVPCSAEPRALLWLVNRMPRHRRIGQWALLAASLGLGSCRDEVVQTAKRSPETLKDPDAGNAAPLDCQGSDASNELPAGTQFGEGDTVDSWPLVADGYGPREGPGLYVLARDTFRAYVNGHLVAESESPRTAVFVPVSLLPGENVIAVSVSAGSGTPAALVQFDDLTRSYVSGSDWKLSTAPEGNWTAVGYDDGSWDSATELAAVGALSGCEAEAFFPENTTAAWIGPALGSGGPVALRATVRIEPVGFAEGTIGGADAAPEFANTWEDFEALASSDTPATILLAEGVHDLRLEGAQVESLEVCPLACPQEPARTLYDASNAPCATTTESAQADARVLHLGSNKTLLGLGRGAAMRGVGFDVGASENIIVRNLAVYDINRRLLEAGDAFTLEGARGFWLDHVSFKWVSDAFADILGGAEGVTLSYVLFDGGTDAECNGQEHWAVTLEGTRATIHHTRFDQVSGFAPYVDRPMARVHLFNNVYSNSEDWTVGSSCGAQVLVEGSVFENVEAVARIVTCSDLGEPGLLNLVSGSNLFQDGSARYIGGDGEEPHDTVFVPEYDYDLEPASEAWPHVISRAGAGGPWALPVTLEP